MKTVWTTVLCVTFAAISGAQEPTLMEMAARSDRPIVKAVGTEEPGRTFSALAANASLIAYGTVRPIKTYLSDDGELIYTDFELTPLKFIAGTAPANLTAPGSPAALIVRQLGGTMTLGRVDVTVVDEHLSLLPQGEPVMLFLENVGKSQKFRIVGEHWGAFSFRAGTVVPLIKPPDLYQSYSGMSLSEFSNEIVRLRGRRP